MPITVKVIEASFMMDIKGRKQDLATVELTYPRFIHAELLTHRVFSRNSSSSRAIPVKKMIEQVWHDPAMPTYWGENKSGMQADKEVSDWRRKLAKAIWRGMSKIACVAAWGLMKLDIHKQIANRILEPWMYIHVLVTATEWENFFKLRDHKDAQPEIKTLAHAMHTALRFSVYNYKPFNRNRTISWHLPFIDDYERNKWLDNPRYLARLSAARCARVSYLTHDGKKPNWKEDDNLYKRLVSEEPIHASPTEHQAYPLFSVDQWSRNFRGWRQHRELVEFDVKGTWS